MGDQYGGSIWGINMEGIFYEGSLWEISMKDQYGGVKFDST